MSNEVLASLAGAIVGAMLGWLGALIQAGAAQDRERLLRYRGIASALRTEATRISLDLGFRDNVGIGLSIAGVSAEPPIFSSAVTALVPDIVSADPEILRLFLVVQGQLQNYLHFDRAARKLHDAADEKDVAARKPRVFPAESLAATMDEDLQRSHLKKESQRLRTRADHLDASQARARTNLFASIDSLLARLQPLADLEIPSLVQIAIERSLPGIPELRAPTWTRYVGAKLLPPER